MKRVKYFSHFIPQVGDGQAGIGRFGLNYDNFGYSIKDIPIPGIYDPQSKRDKELAAFNEAVRVLQTHFPEIKVYYEKNLEHVKGQVSPKGYIVAYQTQMTKEEFDQIREELSDVVGVTLNKDFPYFDDDARSVDALNDMLIKTIQMPR